MMLKAVVFDFGHTILREGSGMDPYLEGCPIELMPGARYAIENIAMPKAIWANTRVAAAPHVRQWLSRAGLDHQINWVVSSAEIGYRKPDPEFFRRALAACNLQPTNIVFVGNQMNTDILGANQVGIPSVYLADESYRSADAEPAVEAQPTFTIQTLFELPALIVKLM
jgi:FMN phosphatase YigB (HAD superfamily)